MRFLRNAVLVPFVIVLGQAVAFADAPPKGFDLHHLNPAGQDPITKDGETTFHLAPGVCSPTDYGDGRNENDCKNGNLRSILVSVPSAKLGQEIEYSFDLWVDPRLKYEGFKSMSAAGFYPDGVDSALRVASWVGPFLHNFLYHLKVSRTNGVDFLARHCQPAADFGKWVSFSLKIKWTKDQTGWVKAACDGKVIYADEGIATNQAPFCWESNQCEPWIRKEPEEFFFELGPILQGFGPGWKKIPAAKSLFAEIQPDGITVKVRNAKVVKGAKLYDDQEKEIIRQLQTTLASLGCDAGPADGLSGKKTRDAAQSCRQFPDGTLPAKLTVATAQTYLAAYTAPEAKALPKGTLKPEGSEGLIAVQHIVHAAEEGALKVGHDTKVNSNILAEVTDWKKKESELFFGMVGRFDYDKNSFSDLAMFLQDSLGDQVPPALKACGSEAFVVFPDGTAHVMLTFIRHKETKFAPPVRLKCILQAVPEPHAKRASFLAENFADIAVGMVVDGSVDKVRHDGVKIFLQRVAKGEIAMGSAPK